MIIEKKLEVNNMTSNENDFMKISASSTLSAATNAQIYNAFNEANLISPGEYPCYHSARGGSTTITIEFKQRPVCLNRIDFQKRQANPVFDVRNPKVRAIDESKNKSITLLDSNIVIGSELNDKGFTEVKFDNYDKYYKDGDVTRNPLSEFNSNNTELLDVEQTKKKLLELKYIRNELDEMGILNNQH